jgi:predicted dehydrogenase
MNVMVIGAGRMGLRHCNGLLSVDGLASLTVVDISTAALDNAKFQLQQIHSKAKLVFLQLHDIKGMTEKVDAIILASTASDRFSICESLIRLEPRYMLIEKPLGQSLAEVEKLVELFKENLNVKAFVNLNTRLYPGYQKLKNDLQSIPQLAGYLTASINTGTLGIGANGIHYIDLIKFLTGADAIRIIAAEVHQKIIVSGRGTQFADFGGWAVLDYLDKNDNSVGRAHLIMSSQSTVYAPWEFTCVHGRILVDEIEQIRFNKYRMSDSELPLQRYAGDYMPIETEKFEVPFLNDLTAFWLSELMIGHYVLPEIEESLSVHKTLFQWLSHCKNYSGTFPIT